MKFGQLTEYNMLTFLLKSRSQNVVKKQFPDLFRKNENQAYLWIYSQKRLTQFIYIICQVKGWWNILKLSCIPLAFTWHKTFLKNKNDVWN